MTCVLSLPVIQPPIPCVGYPGPCGRPSSHNGGTYGVAGRLCLRCRSRARRAHRDAQRPLGDCEGVGCRRAAACRRVFSGRAWLLCERCAERTRSGLTPGGSRSRSSGIMVSLPCVSCGTPDGPTTVSGLYPGRISGEHWGIPGAICFDCAEDARLGSLDEVDDPGTYLPDPETIHRECAAIRAGWSPSERRLRTAPALRRTPALIHRLPGMEG